MSKRIDEAWNRDEIVELSRKLFDRGEQVASIALLEVSNQLLRAQAQLSAAEIEIARLKALLLEELAEPNYNDKTWEQIMKERRDAALPEVKQ